MAHHGTWHTCNPIVCKRKMRNLHKNHQRTIQRFPLLKLRANISPAGLSTQTISKARDTKILCTGQPFACLFYASSNNSKTSLSTNDGSIVGSTTNLYPYFNLPLLSFPWHLFPKHRNTVRILSVISGFPRLLKSFWLTLCQGHSSQQCVGTSREWTKRLDVVSSQCVKVVKVYMSLFLQWVHGNSPYSKGDLGLSTDNRPPPGSKRGGASE